MYNLFLSNYDKFVIVVLLITISISIRFFLQLIGQQWIRTTAHTSTLVLLPIITYVITNVISGNIALSIGMVGALSIVRFRNPVRSPLELSVYFAAITMGIAASVHIKWLIFLSISIFFSSLLLVCINYLSRIFLKKEFFQTSFSEGNSLSSLDLVLSNNLKILDESKYLNVKKNVNGEVQYILVSNNFDDLKNILENLKDNEDLISYQLNK
tara:strand:- start:502 stop:1137 length:636 start_codon:yes stop_codon:yes gene_type:complete